MKAWRFARPVIAALLGCLTTGLPVNALSGDFSVTPIRVYLDKDRKADVVTVKNSGIVPLQFEIRPRAWTQNASGEDVYVDTREVLAFPRLMTLKGGEERDIRIGMKIPPGAIEKTYRVYIAELPPTSRPDDSASDGTNVAFLINFAAPVFFAPIKPEPSLEIGRFDLADNRVDTTLKNSGNVHLFVEEMTVVGLDASDNEVYRETIPERYLLAGTTRAYKLDIPPGQCQALTTIIYNVRTNKLSANAKKDVGKNSCSSKKSDTPAADSAS
ncbi:MAG TPA: fimbria/pilus periplasmic chaperone [Burkholderiales bacterium]|nr:fimbria/pilus periplasmic chaperone [Burkholderiales bacterium]